MVSECLLWMCCCCDAAGEGLTRCFGICGQSVGVSANIPHVQSLEMARPPHFGFSLGHPGFPCWKQPSPQWQMGFGEAPSKQPLHPGVPAAPARALWTHGDKPGDTLVPPSPGIPGTVITASVCHPGTLWAAAGPAQGFIPMGMANSRNTDVSPGMLHFHPA